MASNSAQKALAIRRSKRTNAGKIGHFSPSNYSVQRKRYNLTKNKLISNIAAAASKTSSANCRMTGGGLVLEFSAGVFSFFNNACRKFYTEKNGTKIEEVVDAGGIIEAVKYKTGEYTNNVYLTTSKALVNGRGLNAFVESDLVEIMAAINLRDADRLNKEILDAITGVPIQDVVSSEGLNSQIAEITQSDEVPDTVEQINSVPDEHHNGDSTIDLGGANGADGNSKASR